MSHKNLKRELIKTLGLVTGTAIRSPMALVSNEKENNVQRRKNPRVGHITRIHISPANNDPERLRKCLNEILNHKVDFFEDGAIGNTYHPNSY